MRKAVRLFFTSIFAPKLDSQVLWVTWRNHMEFE